MSKHNPLHHSRGAWSLFPVLFVIVLACATGTQAQQPQSLARNNVTARAPVVLQDAAAALANLPEADSLVYINPHRILTEAAPRILPEKDLAEMRQGLAELKKNVGLDPASLDYFVFQVRFKKPGADLSFALPEFMVVFKGDFDGAALMQLAREASKGKLREETYGSKTIGLMAIDDIAKQAEKTPILKSLSEVAIALLSGDTIAMGTTTYVKAAIDAAAGKNRISAELLNSALRDPTVLVSSAGSPLTAFAKTFALLGTEDHPRASRCDMKLGDFYSSITMDATSFKLRSAIYADNPDTAKIIKSLLSMALQSAAGAIKDSKAQSVFNGIVITPTDTEVLIQADVSQQAVADFIRDETRPKKQETTSAPAPEVKPTHKRRTTRRRIHRKS
ncbi:MAG: hypothetical protein JWM21_1548 [Acidobacteria bacterium]|nr:hypothetical protein [Acidobacteriota bacterium]